jgi:hypothetical protein
VVIRERQYSINRVRSHIEFCCNACDYKVNTLDMDLAKGNPRTQAADLINKHVEAEHKIASFPSWQSQIAPKS